MACKKKKKPCKKKQREKLTARQELFVLKILDGMTQADAYVAAGYAASSRDIAAVKGCALFNNQKVKERYEALLQKAQDDIANALGISKLELAKELKNIAFGDITKFLKYNDKEELTYTSSDSVDGKLIKKVTLNKNDRLQIELYDRMQAIEALCRLLGYDKPEKSLPGENGVITVELFDNSEEE